MNQFKTKLCKSQLLIFGKKEKLMRVKHTNISRPYGILIDNFYKTNVDDRVTKIKILEQKKK